MTEDHFTEAQLASERANARMGINQPPFLKLSAHMDKYGPDGVVESAAHLGEEQYEKLVAKAKRMKFNRKDRRWESS